MILDSFPVWNQRFLSPLSCSRVVISQGLWAAAPDSRSCQQNKATHAGLCHTSARGGGEKKKKKPKQEPYGDAGGATKWITRPTSATVFLTFAAVYRPACDGRRASGDRKWSRRAGEGLLLLRRERMSERRCGVR